MSVADCSSHSEPQGLGQADRVAEDHALAADDADPGRLPDAKPEQVAF